MPNAKRRRRRRKQQDNRQKAGKIGISTVGGNEVFQKLKIWRQDSQMLTIFDEGVRFLARKIGI